MQTIRVGIAGFGLSGKIFQAPFLNAHPGFEIVRVYERSTQNAKEECPQAEIVRSFEQLLTSDIDLVVLSTPNALHVPMARQAILAGKAVVVEKPIAATAQQAQELCDLARERGVLLTVYQNRRLDGDFRTVQQVIDQGLVGQVVDYEAHYDRFITGASAKQWKLREGQDASNLYDLGVHIIDQAYTLFGLPDAVYCDFRKQRDASFWDDNFQLIMYYGDKRAILSSSEVAADPGPHYMVHGRKGSFLKYGMDPQEEALLAGQRPPRPDWGQEGPEHYGILTTVEDGRRIQRAIPTVAGSYGQFYDALYASLTQGAPLMVDPQQCVDVLKILEAALRSGQSQRREPVV